MSGNQFRQVAADFFVSPQLEPDDFAKARAMGIRTVINNRPDGEAPGQLSDAEARACAAANGLAYAFVPMASGGGLTPDTLGAFAEAVAGHEGPYLAYCRSGTRSCHLWAFNAVRTQPVESVIEAAAAAGYDLRPAAPMLAHLSGEER